MKFSEIEAGAWEELRPYLDTCLLPLTGLSGAENPWETGLALEELRDVLDLVEIPFKGRTVTYPALHYGVGSAAEAGENLLADLCAQLKHGGFRYVVLITARSEVELPVGELAGSGADLLLRFGAEEVRSDPAGSRRLAAQQLTVLWNGRQSL